MPGFSISTFGAASSARLVRDHLVGGVLVVVDLDDGIGPVEQATTVLGKVPEVHSLTRCSITRCEFIQGFDGAHVRYAGLSEIQDHVFGVLLHVKLLLENGGGAKEQWAIQLVVLPALLVDVLAGADADGVVLSEYERRDHHSDENGERQVVQDSGDARDKHHDDDV